MNTKQLLTELASVFKEVQAKTVLILPDILGALGIFLIGWVIAHLLRLLVYRLARNFDKWIPSNKQVGFRKPLSVLLSKLAFWMVLFVFLTVSTEVVGLKVVTTWMSGVTTYLPRVLAAVMIGFVGSIMAGIARDMVQRSSDSAGIGYSDVLGKIAQIVVLVVTVMVVIAQVGVDIRFVTILSMIVLGALLGGAALAFGLGSKTIVSNILSTHYLKKQYNVGHSVRIKDREGKIIDITPTAVILDTKDGHEMIPAKEFTELTSVLVTKGA